MVLGIELGDLFVLLHKHQWVASQFEPSCQSILRNSLILMEQKVAQSVDRPELVNVATRDPQHLINALLLRAIDGIL